MGAVYSDTYSNLEGHRDLFKLVEGLEIPSNSKLPILIEIEEGVNVALGRGASKPRVAGYLKATGLPLHPLLLFAFPRLLEKELLTS
jgi:hypothetical protein